MAAGLHISISAEKVASIGSLEISNSILTSIVVSVLLITFALAVRLSLKNEAKPRGLQNIAEWIIEALTSLVHGVTGTTKKTQLFFPIIATFFLFILVNNWVGLLPGVGTIGFKETSTGTEHAVLQPSQLSIPGTQVLASTATTAETVTPPDAHTTTVTTGTIEPTSGAPTEPVAAEKSTSVFVPYLRAGTADLNTTLALALISVLLTQFFGFYYQKLGYLKKFFNFSSPIMFFVGLLELVSEIGKILSFAFRLFGNIFAGEVLLVVMTALTFIIVPMPFYGLEIFVGFIQALVFSLLSLVFFNMATQGHDDH